MRSLPSRPRLLLCVLLAVSVAAVAQEKPGRRLGQTRHNLSAKGPGPVKVAGEQEMCKFCHTPHASKPSAPLWNRANPGVYYQTYESTTLVAQVGQPTGTSRLCLSCHDGTIALQRTANPRNRPPGTLHISRQDRGYLGTDLRDDHPISFTYSSGLAAQKPGLADPATLPDKLRLDAKKQLQCTTCHNPHDDSNGKFLAVDNTEAAMCRICHQIDGWAASVHATTSAALAGASRDKWDNITAATVRQASCEACHRPHTAGGRQRLLRHEAEEDNCLSCHDGKVAKTNIVSVLKSMSRHPVSSTTGVHDPTENPNSMPKHVECVDCHNPHVSRRATRARAPNIKPAMAGASGMTGSGALVASASFEYQVCYKCHAGTGTVRLPLVDRVLINTNVAQEFSPANASYHPVEAQGKNRSVPSLLQEWTTTSRVYCTDCHGNSSSSGPRGPHGSAYRPMLVARYEVRDKTMESSSAYALCYKCHNRSSILGDNSFSEHKKHIVDERTPCSVCHDPHGVSVTQDSDATNLINFDRDVVSRSVKANSGPTFVDRGTRRGSCTLKCHGEDHDDEDYSP